MNGSLCPPIQKFSVVRDIRIRMITYHFEILDQSRRIIQPIIINSWRRFLDKKSKYGRFSRPIAQWRWRAIETGGQTKKGRKQVAMGGKIVGIQHYLSSVFPESMKHYYMLHKSFFLSQDVNSTVIFTSVALVTVFTHTFARIHSKV